MEELSKDNTTQLRVRYYETDKMGVVHHSNYIRWFEMGRTELLRSLGSTYKEVEEAGLMLPVIHLDCTYLKPAFYDDLVEIKTKVSSYTGVKIMFSYQLMREGELLVTGTTTHCWTDRQMKPVPLKKKWPELDQLLKALVEE